MDYDKDTIEMARKIASTPQPPSASAIALLAIKQILLESMGYDPKKEKVDDFLLRKYRELEEENRKLKNQLNLKREKPPTVKKLIKLTIKLAKLKGKQAKFLLALAENEVVYERELMKELYGRQEDASGKLRALKYVICKKLRRLKDVIVIKGIHGKDFKTGYILTVKYNNLIRG